MIYLDYAATCPYVKYSSSAYGPFPNPNAAYAYNERTTLMNCENRIKAAIGVKGGHVLYFRCATEAIEWLHSQKRNAKLLWAHSKYEHDACIFDIDPEYEPDEIFGKDFYIHQWVNHITGEIFDLQKIKKDLNWGCQLIVDATAGFAKIMLPSGLDNIADALFMSGHKIGCPELSFMWLSDNLCKWLGAAKDIRNQWGLHHGSLSVASVIALTDAVEWACENGNRVDGHTVRLYVQMNDMLYKARIEHHDVLEHQMFTCSINAIRLNGINADALQQFLASRGIYIGIGASACAESHDYRVLNAYGLSNDEASEVIRVSFGEDSSVEDVEALVEGIKNFKELYL